MEGTILVNFLEIGFWFGSLTILIISLVSKFSEEHVPPSLLQFIRYGKLNITKIKTNSVFTAIEVPKSWFAHFYLFAVICQSIVFFTMLKVYFLFENSLTQNSSSGVWVASLLNVFGGSARSQSVDAATTTIVTFLYFLHLLRRLYESVFVSVYSNAKMNFFVYLMSYGYYFLAILALIAHSPGFSSPSMADYAVSWKYWAIFQLIGFPLVLYGFMEQYRAHVGFANLRKTGKTGQKVVVSHNHYIPRGGLFELISSPNYWAEILIYVGLTVMFGFQNTSWNAVTVWVITSQTLAGIVNHKWYLANFPEYPKHRNAIIPFIL